MNESKNILGCFVSSGSAFFEDSQEVKDLAFAYGQLFRQYIWGEKGICDTLKKLNNDNYGTDLKLVLFQFYVNPIAYELDNLKEIENYRKSEKAIGIPIIVNNENFFSKQEEERYNFLKQSIFQKLELLTKVVKKKKLDTKMDLLKMDLEKILTAGG
jgi:hypothetical protein